MPHDLVTITTREVAERARVDSSTVRRWIKTGALVPSMVTPGGQYRFALSDVEALLSPERSAS